MRLWRNKPRPARFRQIVIQFSTLKTFSLEIETSFSISNFQLESFTKKFLEKTFIDKFILSQ